MEFARTVFLRIMNPCWFWDLERVFPKYPDFKVFIKWSLKQIIVYLLSLIYQPFI